MTNPSTTMHKFYIEISGRPSPVDRNHFSTYLHKQLLNNGHQVGLQWVTSALAIAESGQDPGISESEKEPYNKVLLMLQASVQMEKQYETSRLVRAEEKAQEPAKRIEKEQQAVTSAQEAAIIIRQQSDTVLVDRIQTIVGDNFDVSKNGGLVIKKGAKLSKQDGFTLIASLTEFAQAGEKMAGFSSLALGDALMAVENKYGEDLDYTQIIQDTGKSKSLIDGARMIARQFPAEKRMEIDPEGHLGFAQWQEVAGRKSLRSTDKVKLAKFASKRGTGSKSIRELASALGDVDEEDRGVMLNRLEEEKLTGAAAIEVVNRFLEAEGKTTAQKANWIFFRATENGSVELRTSNDWSDALSAQGYSGVKWGTAPKWSPDGLSFSKVPFVRAAPDTLEDDPVPLKAPVSPVVPSEEPESVETKGWEARPFDDGEEYYGDFILGRGAVKGWAATGTIEGVAKGWNIDAISERDALNALEMKLGLSWDEDVSCYFDEEGRPFNIRLESQA
jgi:hypothetical protein